MPIISSTSYPDTNIKNILRTTLAETSQASLDMAEQRRVSWCTSHHKPSIFLRLLHADNLPQLHMSLADTPPESPVDPYLHVTTSQLIYGKPTPNRRIHIDDNGVHDFDFKRNSEGPKKLKKFSRRSHPSQRSVSSMSDIPQRTPSDGSETASIRKRFSSLISGTDKVQKTNSRTSQGPVEVLEDPLPDTKQELEIRLNYHLSELDILKQTIRTANDVIRQQNERYIIFQTRAMSDMAVALQKQEQMVEQARLNRDSYVHFVSFHRRQLERIKHKRVEIEESAGLRPTLPEVYQQLWGDEEWARLFAA